jgi:hypothetical protein
MTLSGMPPDTIITMTIRRQLLKLRNNPENLVTRIFLFKTKLHSPKTKAITGNALRLQLDSRKHHNARIATNGN